MRRHFYAMLLGTCVLVSAIEEAHSLFIDSNGAGNETQPVTMAEDQHPTQEPNIAEGATLGSAGRGANPEETQTSAFFGVSENGSNAGTGKEIVLETSSDQPNIAESGGVIYSDAPAEEVQRYVEPNVGDGSTSEANKTPVVEPQPSFNIDHMPTDGSSPTKISLNQEMFRSLVNVFSQSVSQVTNPKPEESNSRTERNASRFLISEESDESSDSLDDDTSDEMLPPMSVLLAQVRKFVQAKTRTGNDPDGFTWIKKDQPILTNGSALEQYLAGRHETAVPSRTVIADSDEDDHSDEQDMSLEVDINLLPEIRRYLKPDIGNREATGHKQTLFVQNDEDPGSHLLETKDLLENPTFQQMMREIDNRLKRASGARGKRLMEKYAEALAVHSSPLNNMARTSITFVSCLPFFITCLLVSLS